MQAPTPLLGVVLCAECSVQPSLAAASCGSQSNAAGAAVQEPSYTSAAAMAGAAQRSSSAPVTRGVLNMVLARWPIHGADECCRQG